jgi:hypothetical protein
VEIVFSTSQVYTMQSRKNKVLCRMFLK